MFKKSLKNKRGFTLIEALVAISILMVAVVAPITIAQKGLSSAIYTKNQMIASYLAQDAIEYVKNKRDENILNDKDWLEGFGYCLNADSCAVDTKYNSVGQFYEDEAKLIKKEKGADSKFEFYGYETGDETSFTRSVNIKRSTTNLDEALINVKVRWDADLDNKVDVYTLIYNY
jgi:prepilin-type N-terminal cleavage/methylation domain-containing protein